MPCPFVHFFPVTARVVFQALSTAADLGTALFAAGRKAGGPSRGLNLPQGDNHG